jgi:hypothetical protein
MASLTARIETATNDFQKLQNGAVSVLLPPHARVALPPRAVDMQTTPGRNA